ncbi:MAG: hypothetical protein R3Y18_00060 [Bacillota bacterium]
MENDDDLQLNMVKYGMLEGMAMKVLFIAKLDGQEIMKSKLEELCKFILRELG